MKIIKGFEFDNYKFIIEQKFNHTECYFEHLVNNIKCKLYINQHLDKLRNAYCVRYEYKNTTLSTNGLSINYSIFDSGTRIFIDNNEIDIISKTYHKTYKFNHKHNQYYEIDINTFVENVDSHRFEESPKDFEPIPDKTSELKDERKSQLYIEELLTKNTRHLKILKKSKLLNNFSFIDNKNFKIELCEFLKKSAVLGYNKKEFLIKLECFLNNYKLFENEYYEVLNNFKTNSYIIKLDAEKFKKLNELKTSNINSQNSENIELKTFISVKEIFDKSIYIKNTTNVKPTFLNYSKYTLWAKNLIYWLDHNKIINEKGIDDANVLKILNLPNEIKNHLNYNNKAN